jgi:hypothetical protein
VLDRNLTNNTSDDLQKIFDNNTLRSCGLSPEGESGSVGEWQGDGGSSSEGRSLVYSKRKALFRIARKQKKDNEKYDISELSIHTGIDTSRWEKLTNNSK